MIMFRISTARLRMFTNTIRAAEHTLTEPEKKETNIPKDNKKEKKEKKVKGDKKEKNSGMMDIFTVLAGKVFNDND